MCICLNFDINLNYIYNNSFKLNILRQVVCYLFQFWEIVKVNKSIKFTWVSITEDKIEVIVHCILNFLLFTCYASY